MVRSLFLMNTDDSTILELLSDPVRPLHFCCSFVCVKVYWSLTGSFPVFSCYPSRKRVLDSGAVKLTVLECLLYISENFGLSWRASPTRGAVGSFIIRRFSIAASDHFHYWSSLRAGPIGLANGLELPVPTGLCYTASLNCCVSRWD